MADYPISNVARRVVYANTGVGPYAFTFEVLANTDIAVYRGSTLLTLTTDYTVVINANGTGEVTLATAGTGNITIVGARAIQRTSDYTTGGDLFASTLNTDLDSQTIYVQQVAETAERGLKAPVVDPTDINMTLPAKATRAGTVLAFDSPSGNPVAGPTIAAVGTVSGNIANINTVATNIANVNTVAGNTSNINTVAGVSGNVTTVAGSISNVNTVADDLNEPVSEINTVATDIANVNTVGTNIANVNTVAGISANVTSVAGNATNINTVAGISSAVSNVSSISSAVSGVDSNSTNINTVAGQISPTNNVATVAGISANVSTVAGISGNVTSVAGNSTNINAVAGNATNINAVAGNATNINAVAGNSTNINTVATNNANVTTVAGISGNVTTVAGISGNVTTVAGISGNVTTVAGISANVTTVATNVADVTNYADTYLGPKTSDPTLRNDSSALQAGDLYFNTTDDVMKVYSGSAWLAAYASLSGALIAANNLSDLASTSAARTNLGLGSSDSPTFAGLTDSGNLTFTGTGNRITGDFSNATSANRVSFQSSTVNSATSVNAFPNGTSTVASFLVFNGSDPDNAGFIQMRASNTDMRINSAALGTGTYLPITMFTGGSERLRIDTSGNVGIGTSSPGFPLDVVSRAGDAFGVRVRGRASDNISVLRFTSNDATTNYGQFDVRPNTFMVRAVANIPMEFWTNDTERMRIDSSGVVGINAATNLRGQLEVRRASLSAFTGTSLGNIVVSDSAATADYFIPIDFAVIPTTGTPPIARIAAQRTGSGSYLYFGTSSNYASGITNSAMVIDFTGNVGIGTSSPTSKLYVEGTVQARVGSTGIQIYGTGGSGEINSVGANPMLFNVNSTERMRITSGGNVGIGTSSPGRILDIAADNPGAGGGLRVTASTNTNGASMQVSNAGGNFYHAIDTSTGGTFGSAYSANIWYDGNYPMRFATNNQTHMILTAGGVLQFNSGYGSVATAYGCRAWCNLNMSSGSPSIRGSGNISSITDNGVGDQTFNFSNAMPDANFAWSVTGQLNGTGNNDTGAYSSARNQGTSSWSSSTLRILTMSNTNSSQEDPLVLNIAVFR